MKILTTLLVTAVLIALGTIVFALSGLYDVSARSAHSGVVHWLLTTTSHASVERSARDIEVPDLSDELLARAGINDFEAMCTACHGGPGQEPEAVGQGLNPPAPDLAKSAAHMNPAELFWVTKNGLKMTGMPAWGETHDDDALWPVVALMTRLGDLDADAYPEGMGHHAEGDDQGSHSHDEMAAGGSDHHDEQAPEKAEEANHDGHDHEH